MIFDNDRWTAGVRPDKLERWRYTVEAWTDRFARWRADLVKKLEVEQEHHAGAHRRGQLIEGDRAR